MPKHEYLGSERDLGRALKNLDKEFRRGIRRAGYVMSGTAKGKLKVKSPRVSGSLRRSWRSHKTKEGGMAGSISIHGAVNEWGRTAGKPPPPTAPILKWMQRMRIRPSYVKYKRRGKRGKKRRTRGERMRSFRLGLAIMIARKIGKKGTKGNYTVLSCIPSLGKQYQRMANKLIDRGAIQGSTSRGITRAPRR